MGGSEGIVESVQIGKEGKASDIEAVDCKWYIRAPPRSKVSPTPFPNLGLNLRKTRKLIILHREALLSKICNVAHVNYYFPFFASKQFIIAQSNLHML